MTTAVWSDRFPVTATSVADTTLKAAARFWFMVAVVGQLIFAFTVASFYGSAVVRGNLTAWNRQMSHRYVEGDAVGNSAFAVHVLVAVVIMLSGALQLIPRVRERAPSLHRWNGRLFILSAFTTSIAGLYLAWVRGTPGDFAMKVGTNMMALLILLFAALALRTAMARDFRTHRRWALRLFLAVSAGWFFRLAFALSLLIFKGPFGFDPQTFTGPFLTFLSFAQFLVPLAVLELYLRARDGSSAPRRIAMATGLLALTVAMGVGIFAATMVFWQPEIKAAFDGRKSIAETLSATIKSAGVDAAVQQYRGLKAAESAAYNFAERELNALGYELIRAHKFKEAIRVFQLNVEAYPRSTNAYDSLAEAYMDDGNKPEAIANYQEAFRLNPNNRNAVQMLLKVNAR